MDHVDILYYHAVDSGRTSTCRGSVGSPAGSEKRRQDALHRISTHNTVDVIGEAIRLDTFDVALVMLNYTMAHNDAILSTIERASKSGIGIVAMKTQAGGSVRRMLTCRSRFRRSARPRC